MLLRHWLADIGMRTRDAPDLTAVKHFAFSADAYSVVLLDGRVFQDNDLERMLELVRDEFVAHNVAELLTTGKRALVPVVDYQAPASRNDPLGQRSKLEMIIQPREIGAEGPPTSVIALDLLVEKLRERITMFNLTGQWTTYAKDNL